jgi:hypothetical protein
MCLLFVPGGWPLGCALELRSRRPRSLRDIWCTLYVRVRTPRHPVCLEASPHDRRDDLRSGRVRCTDRRTPTRREARSLEPCDAGNPTQQATPPNSVCRYPRRILDGRNLADGYFRLRGSARFRDRELIAGGPIVGRITRAWTALRLTVLPPSSLAGPCPPSDTDARQG